MISYNNWNLQICIFQTLVFLSDNEVQEAPDVNHETEKHTEEGDLTVLQGLKKKGEKQRTKKSKQSFAQMKQEKVYDV